MKVKTKDNDNEVEFNGYIRSFVFFIILLLKKFT